ncbi:uncharacterized protein yc1106_06619 [Curvularia clavata]|uniref:CCHC-type domain-containing protein n=1 Tax=Curvularia clavata TaxID=95742 RepID=A0A9Q9DUT9_CURCL|nr:uncharacterized protein yc1106_06619 [Curvularia clavata]
MADSAVHHYLASTTAVHHADRRFVVGVAVIKCDDSSITLGQLREPNLEDYKCGICQEFGHKKAVCPNKQKMQKCKNCDEYGHVKSQCPSIICSNCFEQGHLKVACPIPPLLPINTETTTASDEELAPPVGGLPADYNAQSLTMRFVTIIQPQYASSIGFDFEGSFNSPATRSSREHKSAAITFLYRNIVDCNIFEIETADALLAKHVPAQDIKIFQRQLHYCEEMKLLYIRLRMRTNGNQDPVDETSRPLFGRAMYMDSDFGPFTAQLHQARDILAGADVVTIHFFTVTMDTLASRIMDVMATMEQEHSANPILRWWAQGKVNPQTGMQMRKEDRPASFKISKLYTFKSLEEYITIHFQNLVHELESIERPGYTLTRVRIATFPASAGQLYYAHIAIPPAKDDAPNTHFREGSTLDIITATPYTHANEYARYLRRLRLQRSFVVDPVFEEGIHVVDTTNFESSKDLRDAIGDLADIRCYIRERVPTVGVRRAINTINHMYLGRSGFCQEIQLLLANNTRSLPTVDYFEGRLTQVYGADAVAQELQHMAARLGAEQLQVLTALRQIHAGLLLVQGPGGVGKSDILVGLGALYYRLEARRAQDKTKRLAPPIWAVSPINKQLDDITVKLFNRHQEERSDLLREGIEAPPPIFIRRHMGSTEKRVYRKDAEAQRIHFSEGRWILRRAGVLEPDGALHEIADPDKYTEFQELLVFLSQGEAFDSDRMTRLTLLANQITRAHQLGQPSAVLHDEAGKTPEYGSLAALVFSRPYAVGARTISILPNTHIPYVLFRDIYQPEPLLGRSAQSHPFGEQTTVPLFSRLVNVGHNTVWLREQHRSNSDINDFINSMIPRSQMSVAPGVDNRQANQLASACANKLFGVSKRVIFVSLPSKDRSLPSSKSRYNDSFVGPVWKIVLRLLDEGFEASHIAIISAYTAQVGAYRFIQHAIAEWCLQQDKSSLMYRVASRIPEVECFTVDKMQGAQKDIIIHCTTVAGDLGFTRDNARQLLANSRARSLLIMIGDHDAVSAHYTSKDRYRYRESAYYRAIIWCNRNKTFINLQHRPETFHSTVNNKAAISFDPADQLEEIEYEGVSGDGHEGDGGNGHEGDGGDGHEGVSGNNGNGNVD